MKTHSEAKPESLPPAPQIGPGFLLRNLCVLVVNIPAKQSQFGDGRAASGGRKAQNKPNWPNQNVQNEANSPIANCRNGTGQPAPAFGTVAGFRIVRNEPNSAMPGDKTCETNPIGSAFHAKQSQLPPGRSRARACPELAEGTPKPRSGRGRAPRGDDSAKQSQTWAPVGHLGDGARGSLLCKTKPIPSDGRKSQVLVGK